MTGRGGGEDVLADEAELYDIFLDPYILFLNIAEWNSINKVERNNNIIYLNKDFVH